MSPLAARVGAWTMLLSTIACGALTLDHRVGVATPWGSAGAGSRLVDVNRAGAGELRLLPGIGPGLSKRILEDRSARGAFGSVRDLERVSGIGARTVSRLAPYVVAR
ncbi:MAG: ComEA family DNA-binding protein [Phycisphaerales bacterium]